MGVDVGTLRVFVGVNTGVLRVLVKVNARARASAK